MIIEFLKQHEVYIQPRSVGEWNGWDTVSILSSILSSGKGSMINVASKYSTLIVQIKSILLKNGELGRDGHLIIRNFKNIVEIYIKVSTYIMENLISLKKKEL